MTKSLRITSLLVINVTLILLSGCISSFDETRIVDPDETYIGEGFTAKAPPGGHWLIIYQRPGGIGMGKLVPGFVNTPDHTLVVSVQVLKISPNQPAEILGARNYREFLDALEIDIRNSYRNSQRHNLISLKVSPYLYGDYFCAREDIVEEEYGNPKHPGVILEITARGFQCLDSSRKFTVLASYSERKPKESESILRTQLQPEGEVFLKNVVVTPYKPNN